MAIDDIPIADADARRLARNDLEQLQRSEAPGFRPQRAQLRLEVALRNGLGERETERLRQLTEPQSSIASWRQRVRNAWRGGRVAVTAGVFSAAAVAAVLVWLVLGPRTEMALELEAVGHEYHHSLPDGSTIVLHPGTLGRLDTHAGDVVFDLARGFAEFEVTRDPSRRWDVTAAGYRVSVIGTQFGVRYEPDGSLQVDVQRGLVAVRIPKQESVLQLAAGDQLFATAHEVSLRHGAVTVEFVDPLGTQSSSSAASAAGADSSDLPPNASSAADSIASDALSSAGNARRDPAPSGEAADGARKSSLELQLLSRARQAIAAGDHRAALRWVETHARRYPEGQLVEEREALRVEALRGMGNDELARRAAGEFRKRFPKSVLSPQMPASESPSNKTPDPR